MSQRLREHFPPNEAYRNSIVPALDSSETQGYRYSMTHNIETVVGAVQPLETAAVARGRRRDHSRDVDILEAALDVLAEVGAAGITMDLVAERAGAGKATIYRRWSSKAELVIDAVAHIERQQVDIEHLPDTGTLRGDLMGLFKPEGIEDSTRRLKIMSALASLLGADKALADAGSAVIVQPWADAHYALMHRAMQRGEISRTADITTLSQILPCMAAYRTLVQRKEFTLDFLLSMVDGVLMPALRICAAGHPKKRTGS
jgi:AcrR family transcriptional regulator